MTDVDGSLARYNDVYRWAAERLVRAGGYERTGDLFRDYLAWADGKGINPFPQSAKGFAQALDRLGHHRGRARGWRVTDGVRLRPRGEAAGGHEKLMT